MSVADPFREGAERVFAAADDAEVLRAGEGLFELAGLVDHEPRLRKALTDPAVAAEAKRSLLASLVQGRISDVALAVAGEVVGGPAAVERAGRGLRRAGGRGGVHGRRRGAGTSSASRTRCSGSRASMRRPTTCGAP